MADRWYNRCDFRFFFSSAFDFIHKCSVHYIRNHTQYYKIDFIPFHSFALALVLWFRLFFSVVLYHFLSVTVYVLPAFCHWNLTEIGFIALFPYQCISTWIDHVLFIHYFQFIFIATQRYSALISIYVEHHNEVECNTRSQRCSFFVCLFVQMHLFMRACIV